ncbi:MAG: hypothetical protein Q6J33_02735 [Gloeomargarita sp. DG_2_bins_126]
MNQPFARLWQRAKNTFQDVTTGSQAEQVKKLAQNTLQSVGESVQDLRQQTEVLLQSEGVHHLRQNLTHTAQNVTQKAGSVLGQVTETIQTTATDLINQAKQQLAQPSNSDPSPPDDKP